MVKIKYLFSSLLLLANLIIVPSVFAGGPMFYLSADTDGWINDSGYGRIIRVYLDPSIPCRGTKITFRFIEPKDGDYAMTGSGNSTFIMQEDRSNNVCPTYAKMMSKNSGERRVEVEIESLSLDGNGYIKHLAGDTNSILVDFDGQYHADSQYNDHSYRSSIDDPYNYSQAAPTPTPYPAPANTVPTSYPTTVNFQNPAPTIIYTAPVVDNHKTEELNKKINDLQNQLDQTKKKQSFLEQRINDLIKFIKRIFPFFK